MFEIDQNLGFDELAKLLHNRDKLKLSSKAKQKIIAGRKYLDSKVKNSREPIYGVNTGFGALYKKSVPADQLEQLQMNVLRSHACGAGEEVPLEIVRLMLLLKIRGLSYGLSGVDVHTVQRLIDFYNADVLPVVYQQGSLGASGDLAPLAHLSLPLIGEGEVNYKGRRQPTGKVLKQLGWEPLHLQSKEGIALLNGTQFMSAYGVAIYLDALKIYSVANTISAISLEAFDGRIEPFDINLHEVRAHEGQKLTAEHIRGLLKGSNLISREKEHLQDPYSLRCIPQVHGASYDAIQYSGMVLQTEINSVTDNPVVFPEEDKVISGGNFHGQPLALALDFIAIALAELGSISERRTYILLSGQRGLPAFLVPGSAQSGINSGLMIAQYTAASIVSQNKQLCTPASVDSIISSNGQEDHVSMGANAATKAYKVLDNLKTILAIEMLTAVQALEFRRPIRSSATLEKIIAEYRQVVPSLKKDRILHADFEKTRNFLFGE